MIEYIIKTKFATLAFAVVILVFANPVYVSGTVVNTGAVDGKIEDGSRVIHISGLRFRDVVNVYRGDEVKLVFPPSDDSYTLTVPELKIEKRAIAGQPLILDFKAEKTGVFPIIHTEGRPVGSLAPYMKIVVLQYAPENDAIYEELTAEQAGRLIEKNTPLILDVRTPREYDQGRITNSKLIPIQELGTRLHEIEKYKNGDVLVYCRSGNRSTVAAAIMAKNGFKKIYNLRYGIKDWVKKGYRIEK